MNYSYNELLRRIFFWQQVASGSTRVYIMAASKPMMRLFANRDRYLKAYETFSVYSAKYERQDTWTKTVLLDKIVPHLPNLDQDNELRVLGVGSGSGKAVFQIIILLQYRNMIYNSEHMNFQIQ